MKRMGIDYGDKKVGIALSDDGGVMAFPKEVIINDGNLLPRLGEIIKAEFVEEIILGESRDFKGEENPIMKRIKVFKNVLEELVDKKVIFEPEIFSTKEAERGQEGVKIVDASAATIILQSYIDRKKNEQAK